MPGAAYDEPRTAIMNGTTILDRRHEPRVEARDLVHVEEFAHPHIGWLCTHEAMGRTTDLSHDGMRVELDRPLELGARVKVDLGLGETILRLRGRVRSAREVSPARAEVGLELMGVTPEQYEDLDAYLHLRGD
jgi:hypothetical protein